MQKGTKTEIKPLHTEPNLYICVASLVQLQKENEFLNNYSLLYINYVKLHIHIHPYASRKLKKPNFFTFTFFFHDSYAFF